jgi:hypothetical protein
VCGPTRRLAATLVAAAISSAALVLFSTASVLATPTTLARIVISDTLPGFVASAPGVRNGPLTEAEVGVVASNNSALASALSRDLGNGDLTAYLRVWAPQPPNGEAVAIAAFQWQNSQEAQNFLGGENATVERATFPTFPVPGVADALGYSMSTSVSGVAYSSLTVTFVKGDIAFQVALLTPATGGDLTRSDATSVAARQAENAPGASLPPSSSTDTTSASYIAGEVFVWLLLGSALVGAIVIGVRHERRRPPATVGAMPPQSGWNVVEGFPYDQAFWDGYRWTARRRWDGVGWIDVPLNS